MGKKKSKKRIPGSGNAPNNFYNIVLEVFAKNPTNGYNFRQVSAAMDIHDDASRDLIRRIIIELLNSKVITEQKRGKYQLNPDLASSHFSGNSVSGKVDMKQTGKAYVICDELSDDVFISSNNTGRALHGDMVKVHLFPQRKGRKLEGQIVEIIKRARDRFVGTLQLTGKYAFVIPDSVSIPVDFMIPLQNLNKAKDGEKVIVRMIDWPERAKNPFGEIVEVLGMPGDNDVEMNAILANFDFPLKFPDEVEKEAERIAEQIPPEEIALRKDYREIFTLTIDPQDAKDFDDALSLRKLPNGNWEVGVHIADVSWYVPEGSRLDAEAYLRGTSIYLVDRTIPMLPEKLSNKVCSLRPNEDKLCFAAVFEMNENAVVKSEWFGKTIINSNRRYNYEEVQVMIEGAEGDYKEEIMVLHHLAEILREERYKAGSINFNTQEVKFILDEKGKPLDTYVKVQKEANKLIEDFMLLANRKVAEQVGKVKGKAAPKTFVYRVHDVPHPDKLQTFSEFLQKLGYKISLSSRRSTAYSFNKLFEEIAGKGEENMIETIAVRTMQKAFYTTENIGHYGLAFEYYTHFTSPIRRYPDLMVHRLLFDYLDGKRSVNKADYEKKCVQSSEMERKAVEAERASIKYKQAEYLMDKIGQVFPGLVSGVSKYGIFVELEKSKCEGMVSLKHMNDDFYYLDEDNYRVIGHRSGRIYKLGDPVMVRIKRVDLLKKQMDYEIAETIGEERW
jgi:ribonuclease R